MDRHILGTFNKEEDAVLEVEKLLNNEGYSPNELMLVMDKSNQYDAKIETIKNVTVNKVEVEEESMWEKVKEAFSFGTYESDGSNTLQEYGVPQDRVEHYTEALKAGEIVLLADTDAPKQSELSEVNEDIIEDKESENIMTDKKNTQDDVRSEEPDLTGQEDTVQKEGSEHGYGHTVAKGVVSPESQSPLNTDDKDIKEPEQNTEAPEAEANYSDELEDQGKKSLDDNK